MNYGQLATLGIEKGKLFAPDARMIRILEDAARIANAQMRVVSFADRRPDAVAWPDRKWEWASLRPENGTFDMPNFKDLDARSKWFYQAGEKQLRRYQAAARLQYARWNLSAINLAAVRLSHYRLIESIRGHACCRN